jgi:hypothetical protein
VLETLIVPLLDLCSMENVSTFIYTKFVNKCYFFKFAFKVILLSSVWVIDFSSYAVALHKNVELAI